MSQENVEVVERIYDARRERHLGRRFLDPARPSGSSTWASGKAVRFRWFNDPADALDAVGLRE